MTAPNCQSKQCNQNCPVLKSSPHPSFVHVFHSILLLVLSHLAETPDPNFRCHCSMPPPLPGTRVSLSCTPLLKNGEEVAAACFGLLLIKTSGKLGLPFRLILTPQPGQHERVIMMRPGIVGRVEHGTLQVLFRGSIVLCPIRENAHPGKGAAMMGC